MDVTLPLSCLRRVNCKSWSSRHLLSIKSTSEKIQKVLKDKLSAIHIELVDESHLHAGHAQAGGGGHFTVTIVSPVFEGKSLVERHQLVYAALKEDITNGKIHAMSLKTLTPLEWNG